MPSAKQGKRRRGRILAFQSLFSWDMTGNNLEELTKFTWMKKEEDQEVMLFARLLISGFLENQDEVDKKIEAKLSGWELKRQNRVELAIQRTSVYSLLYQRDIPASVTINEAVEMAKEFANPDSYKFINAVMDGLRKSML
jgi:N utilization substance protein B